MSVRIRLRRMGAKKKPSYRVVVADSKKSGVGRYIESLGTYQPTSEPPDIHIEEVKLFEWLRRGAQPSDTVQDLLSRCGLLRKWEMVKRGQDVSAWEPPELRKSRARKGAEGPPAGAMPAAPVVEPVAVEQIAEHPVPEKVVEPKGAKEEKAAPEKKAEIAEVKKEAKKPAVKAKPSKEAPEEKRKKTPPPKTS